MGGIWNSWPVNRLSLIPQTQPNSLGVFHNGSATSIAGITDGTSNTFLLAETAHGMIAPSDQPWWHHGFAGDQGDTEFDTMYAPNAERKYREPYADTYCNCSATSESPLVHEPVRVATHFDGNSELSLPAQAVTPSETAVRQHPRFRRKCAEPVTDPTPPANKHVEAVERARVHGVN
jgi:hypothetical protein